MSKVSYQFLGASEAKARHQRRISTITSVAISFLVLALILLVLAFILLPSFLKEDVTLVSYAAPLKPDEQVEKKQFSQVERKPSAPSSSTAKVIAANTASPTAIPVPEMEVSEPSLDFGTGDDFGEGWGNGSGDGMGGGGTTFFQQRVSAQRICYVIDYSASMRGERDKLMRKELSKSIGQLGVGLDFQMIFFAGPAWVAGSEVKAQGKGAAEVKHKGHTYKWKSTGGAHAWEQVGKRQKPQWLDGNGSSRNKALDLIQDTPLVYGTDWEDPLEMALGMDPAPQIIFFMTDGSTGGDMVALAKKLGQRAKRNGTIINTVAMMQPKAEKALKELARQTAGQFSIVKAGGKSELVPLD